MSIADLDPIDAIFDALTYDAVVNQESKLPEADRLKALCGSRIWSPIAGTYDEPTAGRVPWRNQVPAIVYSLSNETPQADQGSIRVQAAFKIYGGLEDNRSPTYRRARLVARALRARLHGASGLPAGTRSIMRADMNIGQQAPVDEDGFPFYLAGYAITIQ